MRAAFRAGLLCVSACAILATLALWVIAAAQLALAWSTIEIQRRADQSFDEIERRLPAVRR